MFSTESHSNIVENVENSDFIRKHKWKEPF